MSKADKITNLLTDNPQMSVKEVAKKANTTKNYVRDVLQKKGIKLSELRGVGLSGADQAIKLILEDPKLSTEEAAKEAGISGNTLRNVMRKGARDIQIENIREEYIKQLEEAVPDNFEFDWSEVVERRGDKFYGKSDSE